MYRKTLVNALAFILICFLMVGQNANGQIPFVGGKTKVLKKPVTYEYPAGPTGSIASNTVMRSNRNWVVFSDRNRNQSYFDEACQIPNNMVNYLQAFYVIGESSIALKVVPYNREKVRNGSLARNVNTEEIGWIKKTNLILWNESLLDEKTKFRVKAFSVYKPEAIKNPGKYITKNKVHLYSNPSLKKQFIIESELRIFQFLFVLKRDKTNNSVLVGKKSSIGANSPEVSVLGWISQDLIQIWNERLCLEPNSDETASRIRKEKGLKASIYTDQKDATLVSWGKAASGEAMWNSDRYSEKMDANIKRFPVLEKKDNVYRTGFITGLLNKNGIEISTPEAQAIFNESFQNTRLKASQINVVYVIDGNPELKNYLQPILKSINSSYKKFGGAGNSENKYRFGAVVYRKKSYSRCPNGDESMNVKDLGSDYRELSRFIEEQVTRPINCTRSPGGFSNLNEAMKRGLRMFHDSKTTNIMIVVGGAGSSGKYVKSDEVVADCVSKNVSTLAFQLRYVELYEYERFYADMRTIITKSMREIDKITDTENKFNPELKNMGDNVFQLVNSAITGTIVSVEKGAWLDANILNQKLEGAILALEKSNNQLLNKVDSELAGLGAKNVKLDPKLLLFLHKMKLTQKEIQSFVQNIDNEDAKSYSFFIEGFAPVRIEGMEDPIFEQVILMDQNEWSDLERALDILSGAMDNANDQDTRKSLANAYREILAAHYGRKEAKAIIKHKSISEINELISGISYTGDNLLKNLKIDDIEDKLLLPQQDLMTYITTISQKHRLLKKAGGKSGYSFISFNDRYYWIPAEFLP